MNNDEKVKEMLEKEPVPNELEPENIKKMLDEKAPQKKRGNITVGGRIAAAAAALAVISGGSYAYFSGTKPSRNHEQPAESVIETATVPTVSQTTELYSQQAYMSGATDYSQIYELMKKSAEKYQNNSRAYKGETRGDFFMTNDIMEESALEAADAEDYLIGAIDDVKSEEADTQSAKNFKSPQTSGNSTAAADIAGEIQQETMAEEPIAEDAEIEYENGDDFSYEDEADYDEEAAVESAPEEDVEFSDTHNQEKDVLEADIAKTDGKYIYYISSPITGEEGSVLRSAEVKDGKFLSSHTTPVQIETFYENADYNGSYVEDMYLYNDMIVIIGDTFGDWYENDHYESRQVTYAAFYTTGASPELIDVYYQDGSYNDVRIAPDGNMYLVTDFTSNSFIDIVEPENYEYYIPQCGLSEECGLIPPEDILLPSEDDERVISYMQYSIIGSIDLNESGAPRAVDTKALADYTGQLYASADNFYTSSQHGSRSDFTRIAIGGGGIAPAASATVDGYVKDQFSMSEYDGFFRVAVTRDMSREKKTPWWERIAGNDQEYVMKYTRDNAVYVFDMDMNMVGSIDDFGNNESIKSVSFQGDMAYVVTYRQTDPLFAIDLSDPTAPAILDEFKINGYSTYMQQWSDGLLLGFGVNANDRAVETGIKMVMFDNSDPENLREVGFWSLDRGEGNDYSWVSSEAVWERKALLIAPEKNLIGFPVEAEIYYDYDEFDDYDVDWENRWEYKNMYMFFSYEDGQFIEKGVINVDNPDYNDAFTLDRAMYIGDYVYILSGARFIAADIDTISVTDELNFADGDREREEETTTTTTEVSTTTEEITTTTTTADPDVSDTTEETTAAETTETTVVVTEEPVTTIQDE